MRFLWPRFFHPGRWGETKLPPRLGRRSLSPATELQTENIRAIFPQSCKQQLSRICGAFQVFAQSNHVCNFRSPCWFFSLPFLSGEPSCQAWVSLESGRRPGTAVLHVSSTFGQRAVSSPHWLFSLFFLFSFPNSRSVRCILTGLHEARVKPFPHNWGPISIVVETRPISSVPGASPKAIPSGRAREIHVWETAAGEGCQRAGARLTHLHPVSVVLSSLDQSQENEFRR